jgi:hypothetical protein
MIVWGGLKLEVSRFVDVNTGGRYDPATDSWAPTSTGAGTPSARHQHAAVWTGSRMVVWGGSEDVYGEYVNTGGRYDPVMDVWTPTSVGAGVPTPRENHTAVWTGEEMIVWGGDPLSSIGGRYCAHGCPATTWWEDADGDGFGNPDVSQSSCTLPSGFVDNALDCDDTDGEIYSGAPEINDGRDNQCPGDIGYGVADETSGDSGFHQRKDKTAYCWTAQAGATEYEVRRSSSPTMSSPCAGTTTTETCWYDAAIPSVGGVFHYLNRPTAPHPGSWGQDSARVERTNVCP